MKRNTSLLLTAALGISLVGLPAYAQKNSAPQQGNKTTQRQDRKQGERGQRRRSMEDRYAQELKLTEAQKKQINPILKKQIEQMRAIREDKKLTPEQKREKSQKLFAELPGKINKYLNKEQQAKLKEMVERRKNFQGRRGQGNWQKNARPGQGAPRKGQSTPQNKPGQKR